MHECIHLFPKLQGWRMTSFKRRQIMTFKKFFANPDLLVIAMMPSETDMQQDLVQEAMKYQIEAPAIGAAPAISAPAVVTHVIGSNSSATEIGAIVVRFSTPEKTAKRKREQKNEEDGKRKKEEPRIKKCKGEWQKKAEEADVPNKKKKVEGPKKEALTDEQFYHVPLIQLKALILKIPKNGLANRVSWKRRVQFPELQNIQSTAKKFLQQVTPGEILEVANALMVDDDVEVGREVNFNAISSEYGGDQLEWKKGEEKDNDDKKDVEEKVKSEEEEVQEASADQTTVVSVEEQTLEVEKTKDKASQTKESKEEVEQNKEEVFEGKDDDDGNSQNKPDPEKVIKEMVVDQTNV
ncbi:hypothetical protein GIB67_022354 [Kingdonia uniflora]|uniref:Uncharacterized protein n=1 Tax=Kingdonia uniflora TaxID=39325 RepID=A0A7J7N6C1_9MAGN|nr:hypothetical protein GIB67_022354 [Kingdonia uniflora]